MNAVKKLHQTEPVALWATLAAIFNALQLIALPGLPVWVHTVILVLATVASALAARTQTVPKNQ